MTESIRLALEQLVREAPRWLDVYLVGFTPGQDQPEPVQVDGRSLPYLMYTAADFAVFGYPVKGVVTAERPFSLIPGNCDLMHLRFIADHPGYSRYWWVEDDVRFGGDWAAVFTYFRKHPADLLATSVRRRADDPNWAHWSGLSLPTFVRADDAQPWICTYLPFGAITPAAVAAVDAAYRASWNGHYEAIWPMAIARAGLRIGDLGGDGEFVDAGNVNRFYTSTPVRHLNPGTFQWRPYHDDYDRSSGMLWHPIREGKHAPAPSQGSDVDAG